jgi:Flp pilus assembly protein TadG
MAFLAPVLFGLMVGIWEVGRYVMVQDILDNAAREGGRLSASDAYFASNNFLDPSTTPNVTMTLPPPSTNTAYEIEKKVVTYATAAGLSTTGMTVQVQTAGQSGNAKNWSYTYSADSQTGSGSGYDPSAAADQLDQITVTVSLPYSSVGWSVLGWFVSPSATLTATTSWAAMRNTPLNVTTTIPSQPLQPGQQLP